METNRNSNECEVYQSLWNQKCITELAHLFKRLYWDYKDFRCIRDLQLMDNAKQLSDIIMEACLNAEKVNRSISVGNGNQIVIPSDECINDVMSLIKTQSDFNSVKSIIFLKSVMR